MVKTTNEPAAEPLEVHRPGYTWDSKAEQWKPDPKDGEAPKPMPWGAGKAAQDPEQADLEEFTPPAFLQGDRAETTDAEWEEAAPTDPVPPAEPVALSGEHIQTSDTEPSPPPGHNNPPRESDVENMDDSACRLLVSYVERLERLAEERAAIGDDMKEVRAEAKGMGFDVPTINKLLQRRKMDPDARAEQDAVLELYEDAVK